jgi:hypothetical protein
VWEDFFTVFATFMASLSTVSSALVAPQPSRQQEYYPLWRHVTKLKHMGGSGGSWEWVCNLCKNEKPFKGSYTRVKAHILHERVQGVEGCSSTKNLEVGTTFKREHDDSQRLKEHRAKIGMGGTSKHTPSLSARNEPRIVHEARKRRVTLVKEEISKPVGAIKDRRLLKMLNNQGREEVESRVARAIFACGIQFNVVRSLYWQYLVREINIAPQGFKGPNYKKLRTVLLRKERLLLDDVLKPIRSSWGGTRVSIISDG